MANGDIDTERLRVAARRAHRSTPVQVLARCGLVANGLVHVLIGAIAISVAFGLEGTPSRSGALEAVANTPGGVLVLWVAAVSLVGLAFWQLTAAAWVTAGSERSRLKRRATDVGKAFGFAVVGGVTVVFALGGHSNTTHTSRTLSAFLLKEPGGVLVVLAAACTVGGIGVAHLVRGISRRFREDLMPLDGPARAVIFTLGVVGYVSKAIGLIIVGFLLVAAAFLRDASKAAGLDTALTSLSRLPSGTVLLAVVALGFVAYGLYLFARARFMRTPG